MKIKFIKYHPVGIKKGAVTTNAAPWCQKMIDQGFAEEVKPFKEKTKKPSKTKELK